jgi:hypothetical protein
LKLAKYEDFAAQASFGVVLLEKFIWQLCFVVVRLKEVKLICHHLHKLVGYQFSY